MKVLSLSEAKMKFSALIDDLIITEEEIHITRNGRTVAVLVTPEEMTRLRETKLVASDQDLIKEIKKGLKALKDNKARLYTLSELFD